MQHSRVDFNPVESKVANMKGLFKSILECLQRLGFFCCKQVINVETNAIYLAPIKGWVQCLCYILFWIVSTCLQASGYFVAYSSSKRHNETIFHFLDTIYSAGYSFSNSDFDSLIFKSLTYCVYALHCVMIVVTSQSKKELCEVYNYLESITPTNDLQFARNLKIHSLKIVLIFGCMQICFVGQAMKASGGKANPQLINEILKKKLKYPEELSKIIFVTTKRLKNVKILFFFNYHYG